MSSAATPTTCNDGFHLGPARSRQLSSADGSSTRTENYCKGCGFTIGADDLSKIICYEASIGVNTTLGFRGRSS